ncbi:MAG: hypothetical protein HZB13_04025, partial [Acidobacteria bacterium]|nr:hypothetical protein [Acidobacteriota bacterium]
MLQPRQTLTEGDRVAIRAQLDRMLATPLFKLSKRYPILLRYVVEQTLVGETSKLKERTLGIEVFGRDPDYDTNTDPIVRTTAGEIRKRIAQYYQEPGHEDEIRILFSAGSYIPEFSFPGEHATPSALSGESEATSGRSWPSWLRYAAAMLAGALLFAGGYRLTTVGGDTALRKFWGPVLESR